MKVSGSLRQLGQQLRTLWQRSREWLLALPSGRAARLCPASLQEVLSRRGWAPPVEVLGLEVDGKRVFAVELRRRGAALILERAEVFELPEEGGRSGSPRRGTGSEPAGDGQENQDVAFSVRVVEELERRGFRAREVATVLPRGRTFQRALRLPAGTAEELEAMATLKSEHELPLPPEDACVDFLFAGHLVRARTESWLPDSQEEAEYLVLACAASKEVVEEASAPWAQAGLRPRALDVTGQSAFRALRPLWQEEQAAVCLICVREQGTELVIGKQWPLFTRAIVPGESSPPPPGRASRPWADAEVKTPATSAVAAEVQRSLRAFEAEFPGERVGRVVLVSQAPTERLALEEELGLPVQAPTGVDVEALGLVVTRSDEVAGVPAAAFDKLNCSGRPEGTRRAELPVGFAPALGVAWQEIVGEAERVNFLASRAERRAQTERYRRLQLGALAAGVAVVVMLVPLALLALRGLAHAWVAREVRELASQVAELREVERRLELLRPWTGDRALPLELLAEVTEAATAEAYFHSLSVKDNGRVSLKGLATSPQAAYELVARLAEADKLLSEVTPEGGRAGSDSQFGYEFTLTARLQRWERRR